MLKDAKSTIKPFWNQYIGMEAQISFIDLKKNIVQCSNELKSNTRSNFNQINNTIKFTPPRTNKYKHIDVMLQFEGVKPADRRVILDGHDFALRSNDPVDFVTFDDECFRGAKNTLILEFQCVKSRFDFN